MSSEQKVVVITGASQGIGESLMKGFRDTSYGVVVNARSIKKFGSNDPAVVAVEGDIAVASACDRIVGAALDRFARLDTLLKADFATMTAVNLAGFFHVSRKTASWMLSTGSGHIVNITSAIAKQPMASLPAALAALTKGGLNAVTRSLAIEYATRGVRVNAVELGVIRTPMHAPETYAYLAGLSAYGTNG